MIQVEPSIKDIHSLNGRSLEILARAIALFQGSFSLIVVNCNYRSLKQKLLSSLAAKTGSQYREIWWQESDETLYGKLQNLWGDGQVEHIPALMCLGLEQIQTQNLDGLSARRELRLAQYNTHQEICLELEAKLDFVLGRLLSRSAEASASDVYEESHGEVHSISQIYYQCSLAYWQKADRPLESCLVSFYLGDLWWQNSFVNGRQA